MRSAARTTVRLRIAGRMTQMDYSCAFVLCYPALQSRQDRACVTGRWLPVCRKTRQFPCRVFLREELRALLAPQPNRHIRQNLEELAAELAAVPDGEGTE